MCQYGTCGRLVPAVSGNNHALDTLKSRLSVSYIDVLCSYLDLEWSEPHPGNDKGGWDVKIEPMTNEEDWQAKPTLFFQLKSTVSPEIHEEYISFSLDVKTYKKLSDSVNIGHTLLGLLCLDLDTSKWLTISPEELIMRKPMYW